jgi:flavin reductase
MTVAPSPLEAIVDAATFKFVMRRLAASVTVITSRHGQDFNGMTATAVCSVSAEPPLVLVVVNRASNSYSMISGGGRFALNILREDQADVANYFARQGDKSFDDLSHEFGLTGCPLLTACVATVECTVDSAFNCGSHTIFVGRVVNTAVRQETPLLYFNGNFARIESA